MERSGKRLLWRWRDVDRSGRPLQGRRGLVTKREKKWVGERGLRRMFSGCLLGCHLLRMGERGRCRAHPPKTTAPSVSRARSLLTAWDFKATPINCGRGHTATGMSCEHSRNSAGPKRNWILNPATSSLEELNHTVNPG